jgi:tetratricopeptide (TPR) repeat protein
LSHYWTDRLDESVVAFQDAQRRFEALDRALPNVPFVLYMIAYAAYTGNATAQGLPGRAGEAAAFLLTARRTIDRLRAIDPQDASLRDLSATIRAAEAQAMSGAGRHREALALQQLVVADRRAAVEPERKASPLNRLVIAEVTLGNVAKRAGDRRLACASYDSAGRALAELLRRKEALGFVEGYRDGIAGNLRTCASAEPLSRFAILDGS